jgi:hypothetical protein
MRIISQDRMTDTPYDGAVVYIHRRTNKQIYVGNVGDDEGFLIGTYNSEEDAVYVMSLIQKTSMCNHKYFYMPEAEEVSAIRAKMEEASRNDTN